MKPEYRQRTEILIGPDGVAKLEAAHVLLCGLGGVGGFAAEALARAGVGRLTLIDFDVVSESNINRQIHANSQTIGQKKADLILERLRAINPEARIDARELFLDGETIPPLLDELQPDYVADAIDALSSKIHLLFEARARDLPTITSLGAGGRFDPTAVRVDDLMQTHTCPLARVTRNRAKRRGLGPGILAVWSDEQPLPPLPPEATTRGRPRSVNGTMSYLPALFGLTMGGTIIRQLIQK
ncbi:tRNA threonylcarbamoyladenosine dehydratase [Magnetofaba australis]|uniref:Putative UBA/THIF-type NAD/FAD binding protein n=1 Tax=Magnetofaba australis IT-1 TaxID=1434232 RepID=A0A1Y2K215_9PROT|nr:tRNA threonylcarbamoyladenosine dehydratase [Magnetofaba australis]OSM01992.1 putative UBA/THIF-type NAD/FAD binding protein [Magnetofaba australis IT-1]